MQETVALRSASLEDVIYNNIEAVLKQQVKRDCALRLQDDLEFDSFRIVALLSGLSEQLAVDIFEFEESDLKMESIGDLIRILTKHVGAPSPQ